MTDVLKPFLRLAALFAVVLVSGCASFPYSISEGEIEGHLKMRGHDREHEQRLAAQPEPGGYYRAGRSRCGGDRPERAGGPECVDDQTAVDLAPKVEGALVYDSRKKPHIRRLQLLESSIDSPFFKGDRAGYRYRDAGGGPDVGNHAGTGWMKPIPPSACSVYAHGYLQLPGRLEFVMVSNLPDCRPVQGNGWWFARRFSLLPV